MRRTLVLATNLVVGAALLGWLLYRFGGPALDLLGPQLSWPLLAGFVAVVALTLVCFAWRWRMLLATLEPAPSLWVLTLHRAAGQSLGALIPSARIGGDPLRAWLSTRSGVTSASAITSVAVDRVLEIGAAAPFSVIFAGILVQQGVPELQNALVTVSLGAIALGLGVAVTTPRLRSGRGLVTAFVRTTRLDRFQLVQQHMDVIEDAEEAATRLVASRRLILSAFLVGLATNLVVLFEFWLLLAAFGLPSNGVAIVAAIFGTAVAHQLPVPGGVGVLEGGLMWLFSMLGYPPEVGLAVGLSVRLRELVWALPGVVWLIARRVRVTAAPGELPA